jgi:hypothetical protein
MLASANIRKNWRRNKKLNTINQSTTVSLTDPVAVTEDLSEPNNAHCHVYASVFLPNYPVLLDAALSSGNLSVMEEIMKRGVSVDTLLPGGRYFSHAFFHTYYFSSLYSRQKKNFAELILRQADLSLQDSHKSTVLHHLANGYQPDQPIWDILEKAQEQIVHLTPTIRDGHGRTPIQVFLQNKNMHAHLENSKYLEEIFKTVAMFVEYTNPSVLASNGSETTFAFAFKQSPTLLEILVAACLCLGEDTEALSKALAENDGDDAWWNRWKVAIDKMKSLFNPINCITHQMTKSLASLEHNRDILELVLHEPDGLTKARKRFRQYAVTAIAHFVIESTKTGFSVTRKYARWIIYRILKDLQIADLPIRQAWWESLLNVQYGYGEAWEPVG